MSVLSDVAGVLVSAGLGIYDTTPGSVDSTIFTHAMPDAPAHALSVLLYGSAPPGPFLFDATLPMYENPRLQITARDADGDTAYTACYAAYVALCGLSDVALGGIHYFSIRAVSGPLGLGRDDNNLFRYVVNLECQRTIG